MLKTTGIQNHHVSHSHPDVNGMWGGHLIWIVHYQPNDSDSLQDQRLEIYCHVGNYWNVGKWTDAPGISKMDIFTSLREMLDGNMALKDIWNFLQLLHAYKKYKRRQCQNEA